MNNRRWLIYSPRFRRSHRNFARTGHWILSTSGNECKSTLDGFMGYDSRRMSRSAWKWFDDVRRWTIAHCSFRPWRISFISIFKVNVGTAINCHCVVPVASMRRVNKCEAFSALPNEGEREKRVLFIWKKKKSICMKYMRLRWKDNLVLVNENEQKWFMFDKRLRYSCRLTRRVSDERWHSLPCHDDPSSIHDDGQWHRRTYCWEFSLNNGREHRSRFARPLFRASGWMLPLVCVQLGVS